VLREFKHLEVTRGEPGRHEVHLNLDSLGPDDSSKDGRAVTRRRILVIDDMEFNRHHLRKVLESDDLEVDTAGDGRSAWDRLKAQKYHLVITDLRMPDVGGHELLARVRLEKLPLGVIVLTAFGDPEEALRAMKAGADDFVSKPYDPDRLRLLVKRVLERRELVDELERLHKQMRGDYPFHNMVSKSPKIRRIFDLIEQVGPLSSTVLIHGETGTGKELIAQALHTAATTRSGPFTALNCAVLNESLLESELFGHERGAFTGAEKRKIGRFELANGGTLLLDEIGDLAPSLQAKLLRVLQTGQFERVGGTESLKVDVRIVAATHRAVEDEVKKGRFRADLFYRLNVIRIELPPLRERTEDIPLLATHFVQKHGSGTALARAEIASDTMQALLRHTWPGNVRELENAIKAALAMAEGTVIRRDDLPESVAPRTQEVHKAGSLVDIERPLPDLTSTLIGRVESEYFSRLLSLYKGNVARTARHSGLSRRSVTQKLQRYGLDRATFKPAKRRGSVETTG
jgi:DNA-binding NtrC family response regulator